MFKSINWLLTIACIPNKTSCKKCAPLPCEIYDNHRCGGNRLYMACVRLRVQAIVANALAPLCQLVVGIHGVWCSVCVDPPSVTDTGN